MLELLEWEYQLPVACPAQVLEGVVFILEPCAELSDRENARIYQGTNTNPFTMRFPAFYMDVPVPGLRQLPISLIHGRISHFGAWGRHWPRQMGFSRALAFAVGLLGAYGAGVEWLDQPGARFRAADRLVMNKASSEPTICILVCLQR